MKCKETGLKVRDGCEDLAMGVSEGLVEDFLHFGVQLDLVGCDSQVGRLGCDLLLGLLRPDDRVSLDEDALQRRDALFEGKLHLLGLPDRRHLKHWIRREVASPQRGWGRWDLLCSCGYREISIEIGHQAIQDRGCRGR